MSLVWSLILVACTVSALDTEFLLRRFILFGPGGDPSHQGGHDIQRPFQQTQLAQNKSSDCVSFKNPCRCPMTFVTNLNCLTCNCTNFHTGPLQTSTQAVPFSAGSRTTTTKTITTLAPTSASVSQSTTGANVKITTTIDYCEVAKQLCKANCPDGYLVDPDDCTYCICKKDVMSG